MKDFSGFRYLCIIGWLLIPLLSATLSAQDGPDPSWTAEFSNEKEELSPTGRNPFFILEPGYQLILEDDDVRLIVTVLEETKIVDGVQTRVVEEREFEEGNLIEVSRNFFAISQRTNSVYYFGEEVDIYEDGEVVKHEGAWASGENGARFGLMMPGLPLLGARYYQEIAPGVALDRAQIVSLNQTINTPAGEFTNCLKSEETNPLEKGAKEFKYYSLGIGLIQDKSLKLVKFGKAD
jgi:hypothetical protein